MISLSSEHVPGMLPVSLPRPQDGTREVLVVDAVGPQLGLQADGSKLLPAGALAVPPSRGVLGHADEVAGVDLQPRLVGPDIHGEAVWAHASGCQHLGGAHGSVEAVVDIDGPSLLDGAAQQLRLPSQIQSHAVHGEQLAGDGHAAIDGRRPRPGHHELVVQNITSMVPLQVPVAMVGHAQQRGLIRDAFVAEVELVASDLVRDLDVHAARVAHGPIGLRDRQRQRGFGATHDIKRLLPEALRTSMQVVRPVVLVQSVRLAIELKGPSGDAVGTPADTAAEVGLAVVEVSVQGLVAHEDIDPLVSQLHAHGNQCRAEAADIDLQSIAAQCPQHHLLAINGVTPRRHGELQLLQLQLLMLPLRDKAM
mmetsp:Transcript_47349/g.121854  ORF Transcript_47349/g.121854 Transcript_47349/m.121854 type:complete len:366 (+) Transcript_47349:87-1184(+)